MSLRRSFCGIADNSWQMISGNNLNHYTNLSLIKQKGKGNPKSHILIRPHRLEKWSLKKHTLKHVMANCENTNAWQKFPIIQLLFKRLWSDFWPLVRLSSIVKSLEITDEGKKKYSARFHWTKSKVISRLCGALTRWITCNQSSQMQMGNVKSLSQNIHPPKGCNQSSKSLLLKRPASQN